MRISDENNSFNRREYHQPEDSKISVKGNANFLCINIMINNQTYLNCFSFKTKPKVKTFR